jgi:hypothetical protein
MAEKIISRCGYRCDLCLAFAPNVKSHPENRVKLSDGWFNYFGFRINPEDIFCDGCMEENPKLIDQTCQVRPCTIVKGVANCSYCQEYGCTLLQDRWVVFEELQEKIGRMIPPMDRKLFIFPYENKKRLEKGGDL